MTCTQSSPAHSEPAAGPDGLCTDHQREARGAKAIARLRSGGRPVPVTTGGRHRAER